MLTIVKLSYVSKAHSQEAMPFLAGVRSVGLVMAPARLKVTRVLRAVDW